MDSTKELILELKREKDGLIQAGIASRNKLWEEEPEYMKRFIEHFTRPALRGARQKVEDISNVTLTDCNDWDETERILCERMQNPRFRRKLKKHRQYADAVSMRCVRALDQMIRGLQAVQRLETDRGPDDAQSEG